MEGFQVDFFKEARVEVKIGKGATGRGRVRGVYSLLLLLALFELPALREEKGAGVALGKRALVAEAAEAAEVTAAALFLC